MKTETKKEIDKKCFDEDLKGRNMFLEFRNQQPEFHTLNFSKDKKAKHDGWLYSGSTTALFELKFRGCNITFYPSALIEKDKFTYLTERVETEKGKAIDARPYYVNLYKDNKVLIFDLSKCKPTKWFWKMMPEKTVANEVKMVNKLVGYIPHSQGTKYNIT